MAVVILLVQVIVTYTVEEAGLRVKRATIIGIGFRRRSDKMLPWRAVRSIKSGQSLFLGRTLRVTTAKGRRIFIYGPDKSHLRINPRVTRGVEEFSQFLSALRAKVLERGRAEPADAIKDLFWQTAKGKLVATLIVIAAWLFAALQVQAARFLFLSALAWGLIALLLTLRVWLVMRDQPPIAENGIPE
jgi:hypothetical protein